MASFESVINKIITKPEFWKRCLIGGGLCFIPIINILAWGYLYQWVKQVRHQGDIQLPPWEEWGTLVLDGLRFFVLWFIFAALPLGLGVAIIKLLGMLTWGLSDFATYIILSCIAFIIPTLFAAALYLYQTDEQWRAVLAYQRLFQLTLSSLLPNAIPTLAVWGLICLGWPLYGLACFLAYSLFLPYTCVVFESSKQ